MTTEKKMQAVAFALAVALTISVAQHLNHAFVNNEHVFKCVQIQILDGSVTCYERHGPAFGVPGLYYRAILIGPFEYQIPK